MMRSKLISIMITSILFISCIKKEENVKIPVNISVVDFLDISMVSEKTQMKKDINTIIYFEFDKWDIQDKYLDILDSFINYAKEKEGTITIIGHADPIGSNSYNDNLSLRRAMNVYEYIRGALGEKRYKYDVSGKGKRDLIYTGGVLKENIRNRRVKIIFTLVEKDPMVVGKNEK